MSEFDDLKEHDATQKRMTELKERGDTLRSKDFTSGMLIFSAILSLNYLAPGLSNRVELLFLRCFSEISSVGIGGISAAEDAKLFAGFLSEFLGIIIFLFLTLLMTCFGSVFIFGGWNFSLKAFKFDFSKLDPMRNLGNIYSKRIVADVFKSFFKFLIIASFFIAFVYRNQDDLLHLSRLPYYELIESLRYFFQKFVMTMLVSLVAIVLMDAFYSHFSYESKTKMSTQELKDEHKETEGSGEVKRKIRSLQFAAMKQKINQMVPQATVVITNPTHFAVALQYREGKEKAPKVIAKGKGAIALQIKRLAIANRIPIYQEPPLARAIYYTTKQGGFINPALYMAVAVVLSYIHQLRRYQMGDAPLPMKAAALDIPKEFQFHK